MEINPRLLLNVNVSHMIYHNGNFELFKNDNKLDYETYITLALPFDQKDLKKGTFNVDYKGNSVEVKISKIVDKDQDPILSTVNNIGGIGNFGPEIHLPPEMYTDNRGKYPYYCAIIHFPFCLAEWFDQNVLTGIKSIDYERTQITGGYKHEDKIESLIILYKLFLNGDIGLKKPLVYEDITLFIESYFSKKYSQFILDRTTIFASNNAFKDSIKYFLGIDGNNYISEIVEKQTNNIHPNIQTEVDLLEFVMHNIRENIIHFVEDRRLIQSFWDGSRRIRKGGVEVEVPQRPKDEVDIQPTLYFLLQLSLRSSGIHVVRETDEGIGKLDFKFLYTTSNQQALAICLEFKLAHNKKIEHGLIKQLPAYIRAERSSCGIFAVMWFKDERGKFFKEPSEKTKTGTREFIEEKAKALYKSEGLNIKTVLIDASIKPSASNL